MSVDVSNCFANNCVLCQTWAPKIRHPEKLKRGWVRNLNVPSTELQPSECVPETLCLEELLLIIQPDERPECTLAELPNEVGPLMLHAVGHNVYNLHYQLEAMALKENAELNLEEWLALSPYAILDSEGCVSFERRGVLEGRIDYETTRFFLEIWHGYYGVNNSLRLRLRLVKMYEQGPKLPSNEIRALGFLHSVVESIGCRIVVQKDGSLLVRGQSGLHWIIQPGADNSRLAVPRVVCRELDRSFCIQPNGASVECPRGDYPALYALAMLNDIATSYEVTTLSNGLKKELAEANSGVGIGGLPTFNQGRESLQRIFS